MVLFSRIEFVGGSQGPNCAFFFNPVETKKRLYGALLLDGICASIHTI